jgi:NitT/TauT family transport system ATP-binding protein
MDEPFSALDAITREQLNGELRRIWRETGKTVLFVTHSIPEAVLVGNRILLLSPHPGQVKAELNSDGHDSVGRHGKVLSEHIQDMLFADEIEEEEAVHG